ncbi:multidrug resistance-associated protein 1-like isoform X6 [Toxorhynchites rutilus septentrionalis]|uniref:multidrug resistance-associated protein 1-like isoform X6 n=1 Tax=Toxorhynchites rutilus septentrionalis TaxID=329112 RepID=UPI00247A0518|nr:multidrug resistance-associated protein 1-like isoform X6 [Toxorhynchites rutilus septentrionalis]
MEQQQLLALILLLLGKHYNVKDQTFLFTYWMLDLLINCIRISDHPSSDIIPFVSVLLLLNISLLYFTYNETNDHCSEKITPNLIRSAYFSWFSVINQHLKRRNILEHFYALEEDLQSAHLMKNVDIRKSTRGQYESVSSKETETRPELTILGLLRIFARDLTLSGINRFVLTIFFFVCPFLLRQILRTDHQPSTAECHFYVISIFLVSIAIAALNGQYMYETQKIGLKIKSILMVLIYEKSLRLKSAAKSHVTLLTLDSSRFVDLLPNLHLIWSGPLIIFISVVGLLAILGKSAWIGIFVMITTIYSTKRITDRFQLLQKELMDRRDPRIASTTEALGMIRQIKYFCWEGFFQRRILRQREHELQVLSRIVYWDAGKYLLGVASPFLVSLATFGLMILIGHAALLTLESVFVSIVLFNILKYPLSVLPILSSTWTATRASVDRINEFLKGEELQLLPMQHARVEANAPKLSESDALQVCQKVSRSPAVSIERTNFSVDGKVVLQDIELQLQKSSFVVITGPVGSGKSSLLLAILGEMDQSGGVTSSSGQIAYAAQEPWILHASIRDNILFDAQFDQGFYDEVIRACALVPDLEILVDGDATLLGEKGINISGGQKQRIALARAIYSRAELYLLDDPLCSVDTVVSECIYHKVFSKKGLLAGKSVVLVTQRQDHFEDADCILLLADGRITEKNSYSSYLKKYPVVGSANLEETEQDEDDLNTDRRKPQHAQNGTSSSACSKKVSPKMYLQYLVMLGWFPTIVIIVLNIAIPICDIYSTIWLAKWSIINHKVKLPEDDFYLCIYSVFIVGLSFFLALNSTVTTSQGVRVARKLHNRLLCNIIHQQMTFFDSNTSGQILNRFSSDLDVVDSKISTNFRDFLTNFGSVLSILVLFCANTSLYMVIILALVVTIYCWLLVYHLDTSRQLRRLEASSRSPIILHYNESREGRTTIRAFRQEDRFRNEFMAILDRHQYYSYLYLVSSRWLGVRLELIGAVVVYFVAMLAIQNQATIGASNVGVSISYALRLIPLLNALVRITVLLEENATSLERIDQYLNEKDELKLSKEEHQVSADWPTQGKIEFANFSMNYHANSVAVKNVSLQINAKEKIGIVGRTGAGKSSLISALFRLHPSYTTGSITIDGININRIGLEKLRRSLSIIPQNPLLFSGTLRENLDPFGDQSSDAELWRALECCNLKQLVAELPNQLNTIIDERGSNLSVGQKQLLCLARGILQNTRIVILDEATSSMDVDTETMVRQVFLRAFRDCTVLIISHRKNVIQHVDKMLCMRRGQAVKFEPTENLEELDLKDL